jgi:hypothetical protein
MVLVNLFKPQNHSYPEDIFKDEMQVNIGKLKHDKRNQLLGPGDIVQVEVQWDMKRQNGNLFATILCKYDAKDVKRFKQEKWITCNTDESEDDFIHEEDEVNLEDL